MNLKLTYRVMIFVIKLLLVNYYYIKTNGKPAIFGEMVVTSSTWKEGEELQKELEDLMRYCA